MKTHKFHFEGRDLVMRHYTKRQAQLLAAEWIAAQIKRVKK